MRKEDTGNNLTNRLLSAASHNPQTAPLVFGLRSLNSIFRDAAQPDDARPNTPRINIASTPAIPNADASTAFGNILLLNIFNSQNNQNVMDNPLGELQRRLDSVVDTVRDHARDAGEWLGQRANEFSSDVNALIKGFSSENAGRFRYGFGSKTGANGTVDCSGYMHMTVRHMTSGLVRAGTLDNATAKMFNGMFATGAAYQFENISKHTDVVSEQQLLNGGLREGMILGIDTGDRGWDRGRPRGIDHIAIVFRDEDTGKLMVSESASRVGSRITDAEDYVRRFAARGTVYGADLNDAMRNCAPGLNASLSAAPTIAPPTPM